MKMRMLTIIGTILLGLGLSCAVVVGAGAAAPVNQVGRAPQAGMAPALASSVPYTTVVYATSGDPDTLDPALDYESTGGEVLEQTYDTLVTYDRERADVVVPMLAVTWTVSGDEKTYTFSIRPGVKFHNGDSLTADDVAYSLQRGLLQGGSLSPQWLFTEAFFGTGTYDITHLVDSGGGLVDNRAALQAADPAKLLAACQAVTSAIAANPAGGTVTLHLAQPWSPLLVTLANTLGSIMDKSWTSQHGGWDGNCGTWQNFYAPTSGTDPLTHIVNGTGPYMLDHWTPGSELVLVRNPNYWVSTPLWPGGPTGPAAIERVDIRNISDSTTRANMLLSGDADVADASGPSAAGLTKHVLLEYDQPDGLIGTLRYLTGTLRSYGGELGASAQDAGFNYAIVTDTNQYIGSGTLDGHGIPANFFTDIHVRKAFNYSFNWTQYISDVYVGGAIQRRGPIIKGIEGYTDTQPAYFYSPTLALQEFNLAWGGQVATQGFSLTLSYIQGNTQRQRTMELLKSGIEGLGPKFHVNVVGLPFSSWNADSSARRLPIFADGWLEDIPHPHNWVVPYLIGTYANRQSLPADQRSIFQAKINNCLALTSAAAETCYEDIQNTTYLSATDIFLAQSYIRVYRRAEVRGSYLNLALNGPYFYALSKGPLPVIRPIAPGSSQSVNFTSALGPTGTLSVPAGAVTQSVTLAIVPDTVHQGEPATYTLGSLAFDMQAYDSLGNPIAHQTFAVPVTLTLHYTPQEIAPLVESALRLFWWDGSAWQDAACGPYARDLVHHTLQVPLCHLSQFALGGATNKLFLPLARR